MTGFDPSEVRFDAQGLVPAVLQDHRSGQVLMVAWMNEEALSRTLAEGEAWFWSRSRQQLWHKGATSGNVQRVVGIHADCDKDTLLVRVEPAGPACHQGTPSCFQAPPIGDRMLEELFGVLQQRDRDRPPGSYTVQLLEGGIDRVLRKVGEEATETIIAGKNPDPQELVAESADLIYHLWLLLVSRGVPLEAVKAELRRRSG